MESQQSGMNEQGLFDIYEQWHVPFWQTAFFYILCAVACFLVATVIVYYIVRHYKSKRIVLSCWDQALHDLNQLKKNKATVAEGKHFYGKLTGILKKYVHQRYDLDEGEKTDQEFIQHLLKKDFSPELTEKLQTIFMGSLVVKFANVQAIQEQIEKDLALAISFIKQTQPSQTKK